MRKLLMLVALLGACGTDPGASMSVFEIEEAEDVTVTADLMEASEDLLPEPDESVWVEDTIDEPDVYVPVDVETLEDVYPEVAVDTVADTEEVHTEDTYAEEVAEPDVQEPDVQEPPESMVCQPCETNDDCDEDTRCYKVGPTAFCAPLATNGSSCPLKSGPTMWEGDTICLHTGMGCCYGPICNQCDCTEDKPYCNPQGVCEECLSYMPCMDPPIGSPPLLLEIYRDNGTVCTDYDNWTGGVLGKNVKWHWLNDAGMEFFETEKALPNPGYGYGCIHANLNYPQSATKTCTLIEDCDENWIGQYGGPHPDICEVYHQTTMTVPDPSDGPWGAYGTIEDMPAGTYTLVMRQSSGGWNAGTGCSWDECGGVDWTDTCPTNWWTDEIGDHIYHMGGRATVNGVEYESEWYPHPDKPRLFVFFQVEMPAGTVTLINQEYKQVVINDYGEVWSEWHPI